MVALTAVIGSGKTILSRRLRAELEREGRVIVSRSLSVEKGLEPTLLSPGAISGQARAVMRVCISRSKRP